MREQLGTDYYQFGYHSMNNVFVQPAALIRGLADTLPDNVWLMENNPVESVDGGGPYIVRTRNGPFSADNVILANNAFARRLGFLRSRLVTIYTYAGVTPVLDAAQQALLGQRDQWGVIPANRLGTTLRRIRGGRFMVRSAYSYEAEQPLERMAGQLRASFQRRYPQLAAHDFEYVWSGSTALTGNGASFVGEVRPGFTPPLAAMARASSRARSTAACWPSASPASAAPCWMTGSPGETELAAARSAAAHRGADGDCLSGEEGGVGEVEGQRGQSAGRFRKSAGFRISIPWNGCSSSRSLSPVRIIRASPFRAISRICRPWGLGTP